MKTGKVKILTADGAEVDAAAPVIVSASRATDIPAFYAKWFFNRLEKGYCIWSNPFSGRESYVSFKNTRFIVFWSKNPKPLLPYIVELEKRGIPCYVQYTLNDYEEEGWESGVPSLDDRIATFKAMTLKLGPNGVIWRFDPLLLTDEIGVTDLLNKIRGIAERLSGHTEKLVFSFADIEGYAKVRRNLETRNIKYREWTDKEMRFFASRLAEMNKHHGWGFRLATCGEKIDLREFDIDHNRCIDDVQIARMAWRDSVLMKYLGIEVHSLEPSIFGARELPPGAIELDGHHYGLRTKSNHASGQRKYCQCIESKDIGRYDTCAHGCWYCYANSSPERGAANHAKHEHQPFSERIL